jgi:hypothetical protein
MVKNNELKLEHYFEKKKNAKTWDIEAKSLYIESLIYNFPVIPVVVVKSDNLKQNYLIIDGLQRAKTIVEFRNNEFELQELTIAKKFNGLKYSQIPCDKQRILKNATVVTNIIIPADLHEQVDERILYEIFERLNYTKF